MESGVSEILRKMSCALRTEWLRLRHRLAAVGHDLARAIEKLATSVGETIGSARDRCAQVIAAQVGTPAWSQHTLQLVYDVAAPPATFDFARQLAAAEVERRRRGLDAINVVFILIPESSDGGEPDDDPAHLTDAEQAAAQRQRLDAILIPMLALLPSVRSFAVCGSRDEAQALIARNPAKVYPCSDRIHAPPLDNGAAGRAAWPMLQATDAGRQAVTEFLEREAIGRRPVVITLRNCDNGRSRNGRAKDWLAFADRLDPAAYAPIFVHDPQQMLRGVPCDSGRHIVCHAASWSLDVRMALYEAAWLNVAIMHGPMELCRHSEHARYLLFVAPEMAADATPEEGGNRLWVDSEFAKPYQRMVWKRVHLAALQEAFADMERVLRSEPGG